MMDPTARYWISRFVGTVVVLLAGGLAVWAGLLAWWFAVGFGFACILLGVMFSREAPPVAPENIGTDHADQPASMPPSVEEIAELVEQPLLVIDAKRRVELANGAAKRLLGDHIAGQDIRLALRNPVAAALLTAGAASGSKVELLDLGPTGERWELHADPLGERQIVRLVDRTALRTAEKMRVDFVANASHELRTPLATILGFIETLEGPAAEDSSARQRFLGIMRGEANRMIRMVDDLISLSRIEADKHRAPTDPVDLVSVIDEVRDARGRQLATAKRELVLEVEEGLPSVAGDRDQLLQLLHNLVGNSIKYAREGTPITVRLRKDGQTMIRMSVEDEGEGIPPEHLPRLTERFYRADASRSRSLGGTGLGLAIVKHIVERHRGQLLIESEPGRGTRITTILPAHIREQKSAVAPSMS